jgi:hypothetical protein
LPDCTCAMCGSHLMESGNHLFFDCPFCLAILAVYLSQLGASCTPVISYIDSLKLAIRQPFALKIIVLVTSQLGHLDLDK